MLYALLLIDCRLLQYPQWNRPSPSVLRWKGVTLKLLPPTLFHWSSKSPPSLDLLTGRSTSTMPLRTIAMISLPPHVHSSIPQILLVMLFLQTLHSRYSDLLEQFHTCLKSIEHATIDSIRITTGSPSTSAREPSLLHLLLVFQLPLAPTQIRRAMFGKCHLNGCRSSLARNQSRLNGLVHSQEQASALSATVRTSPGTSLPIALCSRNSILSWK
jgi:hypothetical protein